MKDFETLKILIEKENEHCQITATHRDTEVDGYYATRTVYEALRNQQLIGRFEETTMTNLPVIKGDQGEQVQYESVIRKTCITDYIRICSNLESLPNTVEKELISSGMDLPINTQVYKDMLLKND